MSKQSKNATESHQYIDPHEPIAVIGMSCRFPGGANSLDSYWEMLKHGVDAITEIPADRWDNELLFDPDPMKPGTMNTRWGGFIDGVDQFDPEFFGIAPREANLMDPQQRILLELSWEALEHAGQVREKIAGTQTGIFVGIHGHSTDYKFMQFSRPNTLDSYTGTGTALNVLAGRVSYMFDFHGPAVTVDTACSSSLVAMHWAVQSLRQGESEMALVSGMNLMLEPQFTIVAAKTHLLAEDGRCKTFDARANGIVRSEGCGVIVLKRLTDAQRDGDRVLAVIRGSAINQDGRSNGLTAPNGLSQINVIRQALASGGVDPSEVTHIEAHGTGTSLGDPIEVEALDAVYGRVNEPNYSVALGSVKSNMGHLEGGAGIAGFIKAVLSIQHRVIPPLVHFQTLNPYISIEGTPFSIPQQLTEWDGGGRPLMAGVSSFGMSGTNAHIVVGQAPDAHAEAADSDLQDGMPVVLPLSAHLGSAVKQRQRDMAAFLQSDNLGLGDVAYTSALRRTHHTYRAAAVGRDAAEMRAKLLDSDIPAGFVDPDVLSQVVFVFPGQGSQWIGMGRDLMQRVPVFRQHIDACATVFEKFVDWSLLDQLNGTADQDRLDEINVIQPTLFAIQTGLAAVWRSWGVEPDAVIGHSMGEVAASYVAGALSLEDAASVICLRSLLMRTVSGHGSMALVGLDLDETKIRLSGYESSVAIAASNSPRSTVISGDSTAVEAVLRMLEGSDIFCRLIKVDVASHSPQVDPLQADLMAQLSHLTPQAGSVPIYSTVLTDIIDGTQMDADYWVRNLRQPVMFAPMVERVSDGQFTIFMEMSPHPVLLPAVDDSLHSWEREGATVAPMRRNTAGIGTMAAAVAKLFTLGVDLDWAATPFASGRQIDLPAYPWQHASYWMDMSAKATGGAALDAGFKIDVDAFLGQRLPELAHLPEMTIWSRPLDKRFFHHWRQISGADSETGAVLSDSMFIALADAAAKQYLPQQQSVVTSWQAGDETLFVPGEESALQISAQPGEQDETTLVQIFGRAVEADRWSKLGEATVSVDATPADWIYDVDWVEFEPDMSTSMSAAANADEQWIIFAPQSDSFAQEFLVAQSGRPAIIVTIAHGYQKVSDTQYEIAADSPADYKSLLSDIAQSAGSRQLYIVHAFGLDMNLDMQMAMVYQRRLTESGLYLLQAVNQLLERPQLRVWFVTRGAQLQADGTINPVQAPLWGMGRTAGLEFTDVWGGLVDLDLQTAPTDLEQLMQGIRAAGDETEFVQRNGQLKVSRLVQESKESYQTSILNCSDSGSYLITGGLGVLGLQLAKWLIGLGARNLILTSRSGLEGIKGKAASGDRFAQARLAEVEALQTGDVNITFAAVNVADLDSMRALFDDLKGGPALRGVIHAAGVAESHPLAECDKDTLYAAMQAKLDGTVVLHQLLADYELDFQILFSSGAAVWGSHGLAPYGAGNAFLDAYAAAERAAGRHAVSVNWGYWRSDSQAMAALSDSFEQIGMRPMDVEPALACLNRVVSHRLGQRAVADIQWDQFKPIFEARRSRPFFEQISAQAASDVAADATSGSVRAELDALSSGKKRNYLTQYVRQAVATVLGFSAVDAIDDDRGFFKMGMDSITTVQLRNRLEGDLATDLPPTIAFEYPSVEALTNYLFDQVVVEAEADDSSDATDDSAADEVKPIDAIEEIEDLDDLSEDDLLSMFDDELAAIDDLIDFD